MEDRSAQAVIGLEPNLQPKVTDRIGVLIAARKDP
jgi:hypothetical protein